MHEAILRQCFAGLMQLERESAQLRATIRKALSVPNGHANRLTPAEATELLEYLSDSAEHDIRAELGMTPELARQAAARQDLAPAIIARIQLFLATGSTG